MPDTRIVLDKPNTIRLFSVPNFGGTSCDLDLEAYPMDTRHTLPDGFMEKAASLIWYLREGVCVKLLPAPGGDTPYACRHGGADLDLSSAGWATRMARFEWGHTEGGSGP